MTIQIISCTPEYFELVKNHIKVFELDNRDLKLEQFLIAINNKTLVGFGRIREYEDCAELCSIGVIEPFRKKGVASSLTKELIKKSTKPLYLVCIIPQFFEKLCFSITTTYPFELQNKKDYCTSQLVVEEKYVVMKI